jgi:P-type Ca2+ transporter type 2C
MKKENQNNFHSLNISKILNKFDSTETGLSSTQVEQRLKENGLNEFQRERKYNYLFAFLRQFKSIFVYILLLAAGISYYVGNLIDVYVIAGIIIINISIGFLQEEKAERSMKALRKLVVSYVKVYRNRELIKVNSKELVVGDRIFLEEGDRVPSDARLMKVKNFKTNESSLTGESLPVEKDIKIYSEKTIVADRKNMVFLGTFVVSGSAEAIVVSVGNDTEIGKVAKSITKIKKTKSHFQEKIDHLAFQMGIFAVIGVLITFIVGYFYRGFEFTEIFLFAISSLVSGIPEGLPAILSIVLAIGALRMSKRNAIIRHLPSTETLGVVNTIITDKTGTLTKNTMTVTDIYLPNQKGISVKGVGWEPKGDFSQNGNTIIPLGNNSLKKLLEIASVSTNSRIIINEDSKENRYTCIGDPTEASLVVLSEKAGLKKEVLEKNIEKIDELPFNQDLRFRANLSCLTKEGSKKEMYIIGAPEAVLDKCSLILNEGKVTSISKEERISSLKAIDDMTSKALRVIAIGYKEEEKNKKEIKTDEINNLVFVGFVGMIDPPREGIKESLEKAKNAGIRVIMATGDHKNTAVAIARNIGLVSSNSIALSQTELEKLSEKEFRETVMKVNVFARLTPNMKLKIAEALQKEGLIIAMTGDGVNDAPALKKADIGISMGINGTDVARESSEMVLADDNFSSIIYAIEEGRIVFNNTKRASFFLVTTNMAEYATITTTLLLGLPLPLLPTQILWLNLVTDTGAGIGLASEPGHQDILNRKPRNSKENLLTKEIIPFFLIMGGLMVLLTTLVFVNFLPSGIEKARTGAFLVMAFTQIYNAFNMRSIKFSVFKLGFLNNKVLILTSFISLAFIVGIIYIEFLRSLFSFAPISILEFLFILLIAGSVLVAGELYKIVARKFYYKI